MIQYVLLLVTNPQATKVVGLIKDRGPAFLVGKKTFPGGKIDPGESLEIAAAREMAEETGLQIAPGDWTLLSTYKCHEYVLYSMGAISENVENACTQESEEVIVYEASQALREFDQFPDRFVSDFKIRMDRALAHAQQAQGLIA